MYRCRTRQVWLIQVITPIVEGVLSVALRATQTDIAMKTNAGLVLRAVDAVLFEYDGVNTAF